MFKCSPCGNTFTDNASYEQHLQSEEHKKKTPTLSHSQGNSTVNLENGVTASECKSEDDFKCDICSISFDSAVNFRHHSNSREHALKVLENQAESSEIPSLNNTVVNSRELNGTECKVESANKECILPELNEHRSSYLSYQYCKLCCKMLNGPEPYKQHIESQGHKKKIQLGYPAGERLKCEPCNKYFSGQIPYEQHINSVQHKKKIQNIEAEQTYLQRGNETEEKVDGSRLWYCRICNVQCSGLCSYRQHLEGIAHYKKEKRLQLQESSIRLENSMQFAMQTNNQDSFVTLESSKSSVMQMDNSDKSKILPKPEMTQTVNGNYLNGTREKENDFVLSELVKDSTVASVDKLEELVQVIPPDEKINFDELDKSEGSKNEKIVAVKQNESQNDVESGKLQKYNENGFDDYSVKDAKEEEKCKIYKICQICNVILYNEDGAMEHFESKEHYEKKWGSKA